jgi:tRNA 2-thiouridine synthesizing protein A
MHETRLDLRGLKCPLPALKTKKALSRMAAGEELVIECTDPLTSIDIPNLLRETGDALVDSRNEPELLVFHIRKK